MLFAVQWDIPAERRNEANERFKSTGGPPPDGVKMLGRWHGLGDGEGFLICESDSADALAAWMQEWSDLMKLRVKPVVDDAGVAKAIG